MKDSTRFEILGLLWLIAAFHIDSGLIQCVYLIISMGNFALMLIALFREL